MWGWSCTIFDFRYATAGTDCQRRRRRMMNILERNGEKAAAAAAGKTHKLLAAATQERNGRKNQLKQQRTAAKQLCCAFAGQLFRCWLSIFLCYRVKLSAVCAVGRARGRCFCSRFTVQAASAYLAKTKSFCPMEFEGFGFNLLLFLLYKINLVELSLSLSRTQSPFSFPHHPPDGGNRFSCPRSRTAGSTPWRSGSLRPR